MESIATVVGCMIIVFIIGSIILLTIIKGVIKEQKASRLASFRENTFDGLYRQYTQLPLCDNTRNFLMGRCDDLQAKVRRGGFSEEDQIELNVLDRVTREFMVRDRVDAERQERRQREEDRRVAMAMAMSPGTVRNSTSETDEEMNRLFGDGYDSIRNSNPPPIEPSTKSESKPNEEKVNSYHSENAINDLDLS